MTQNFEPSFTTEIWEEEAAEKIRQLLESARWCTDSACVYITSEEAGGHSPTFNSLKSFREYLVDQFTSVWCAEQPNDGSFDPKNEEDTINELLEDYRTQIQSLGWEL